MSLVQALQPELGDTIWIFGDLAPGPFVASELQTVPHDAVLDLATAGIGSAGADHATCFLSGGGATDACVHSITDCETADADYAACCADRAETARLECEERYERLGQAGLVATLAGAAIGATGPQGVVVGVVLVTFGVIMMAASLTSCERDAESALTTCLAQRAMARVSAGCLQT